MKTLAWIVTLVAVAVGVALASRYLSGAYALLVVPPWRVEVSFSFLLVALAAAFVAAYLAVRAVAATVRLPARVREYRLSRRRERGRAALAQALLEFFAGRFGRAEKAAATAIECGESVQVAAVLAARAAHELRAWERRDGYLERAGGTNPDENLPRVVTEAELLLGERRYAEALERLKELPRKHTAALRLELRAQQELRNWERVVALAGELGRRGVFDATQAGQVRRYAIAEDLGKKALDRHAFEEAWRRVAAEDRVSHRVAAAAARGFMALGDCDRAYRAIEDALETEWDAALVTLYAECEGGATTARIERAEAWLARHPEDAPLLLTLGRLCARASLWGKARSYLEASIAIEPTRSAHLALAQVIERIGDAEGARTHYRVSLDLALAQLKAATGGRRRTPL
ncbi:MAG: hypothetical protein IT529_20065 [Burkholderiales bacterium]|nr:hypothetical protein [Burkholderiales bacterium]